MGALHPADPFGDLDVRSRRNGIGIVVGGALNVDDPRQPYRIGVEDPGPAIGAEMAPAMLRRHVDLGRALRHLDRALRVHRPADQRRAGMAPTIRAMAQRVSQRLARRLIADCAAMTAAGDHRLLSSGEPAHSRRSLEATAGAEATDKATGGQPAWLRSECRDGKAE